MKICLLFVCSILLYTFVNCKSRIGITSQVSPSCFSQIYISSGTNFHISHISDTFYSEFSYVSLSSDISGDGVFSLLGVEFIHAYNSLTVSNLFISQSEVYIVGGIVPRLLTLNSSNLYLTSVASLQDVTDSVVLDSISHIYVLSNLSYKSLSSNKLYSNKYPTLFFYCDNSICFLRSIESKVISVGEIALYSSIPLKVLFPPP